MFVSIKSDMYPFLTAVCQDVVKLQQKARVRALIYQELLKKQAGYVALCLCEVAMAKSVVLGNSVYNMVRATFAENVSSLVCALLHIACCADYVVCMRVYICMCVCC